MRAVLLTICALVLVMFIVPMAFGMSGWLNDQFAGKRLTTLSSSNDFIKMTTDAKYAKVTFTHTSAGGGFRNDSQTLFGSNVLHKPYAEVVLASATPTSSSGTRSDALFINLNISTAWAIDHRLDFVRIYVNYSSAKTIGIADYDSYTEVAGDTIPNLYSMWRMQDSVDSATKHGVQGVFESFTIANESWADDDDVVYRCSFNVTNTEWRYVDCVIDQVNLLRAADLFSDKTIENESLSIVLDNTGATDGTSLVVGDDVKFYVELYSSVVSPYSLVEISIGAMGITLCLFAIWSTPYVNPMNPRRQHK